MRSSNLFTPVKGSDVSEQIALQIETAILSGQIEPGERLSSERDLQQMFEAGRGAIREALKSLKQKGIIEIKKGVKGGAYIKKIEVSDASESMALLIMQNKVSLEFLVEFRDSIDSTVAILSSNRGTKAERKELLEKTYKLAEAGNREPEPDLKKVAEIDQQLNLLLARMTKNPMFEWVKKTIQLSIGSYDYILYEDPEYRSKTIENWIDTSKAVAAGETLKAVSFCAYHYVMLRRCIEENNIGKDIPAELQEKK